MSEAINVCKQESWDSGLQNGQNVVIVVSSASFPRVDSEAVRSTIDTCVGLDVAAITNQCAHHEHEVKVISRKLVNALSHWTLNLT